MANAPCIFHRGVHLCIIAVDRCCVAHVEGFGLTCGYLDNSVGLSSVLAGKSRKCSIKLHPTSGALQAESPDALTGVLGATNRKRDSRIKSFASCVKTYMKKIGAIVVAALLSPY